MGQSSLWNTRGLSIPRLLSSPFNAHLGCYQKASLPFAGIFLSFFILLPSLDGNTSFCSIWFVCVFFWPCHLACEPPALEVWSLNHWTTREVPGLVFISQFY